MSMASSSSPISRWSRGSNVERGDLADLAQHDVVVFAAGGHAVDDDVADALHRESVNAASASLARLVRRLHPRGELLRLRRRGRPSPLSGACATCLPNAFCSARSASNSVIAVRRAASAATAVVDEGRDDSPRSSCERLISSGFSRSSTGSITRASLARGIRPLGPCGASSRMTDRRALGGMQYRWLRGERSSGKRRMPRVAPARRGDLQPHEEGVDTLRDAVARAEAAAGLRPVDVDRDHRGRPGQGHGARGARGGRRPRDRGRRRRHRALGRGGPARHGRADRARAARHRQPLRAQPRHPRERPRRRGRARVRRASTAPSTCSSPTSPGPTAPTRRTPRS